MRVIAMSVEKYRKDLERIVEHTYKTFRNQEFLQNMEQHMSLYEQNNGAVFDGKY
jgi:hypothetical protein